MVDLKEHNLRPYEQVEEAMRTKRHVIYVSGVGTGKSFIFLKLVADSTLFQNKRCLYIMPQQSVGANLMTYPEYREVADRVTFINMQQFTSVDKACRLFSHYDLIVMDEAHHLGSDLYGRCIMEAVTLTEVPFLGLTATPIRADRVDIRDEFAVVVDGISNFDAIRLGLMPQFTYRIGVPDEDLAAYRKRLKNEQTKGKHGRIIWDYSDCESVIRDIANTYPRRKYIIFSGNIAALERDREMIASVFSGKPVFEMHSKSPDVSTILHAFNEAEEGVLMTVDMALEGIHLSGVDGIILLRNVQSIPVFQQMLGRVCSIGKKTSPVVIDCSARGVELLQKLLAEDTSKKQSPEEMSTVDANTLPDSIITPEADKGFAFEDKKKMSDANTHREIMHITLGSHEEWKDIEAFEQAWAQADPARHTKMREDRIAAALKVYRNSIDLWQGLPQKTIAQMTRHLAAANRITTAELFAAIEAESLQSGEWERI